MPWTDLDKKMAWLETNRERKRAYMKKWREENRDHVKSYNAKWKRDNHEHVAAYWQTYYPVARTAILARIAKKASEGYYRRAYATNPARWKRANLKWRAKNPEKRKAAKINRRSLEAGANGKCTAADIQVLLKAQSGKCVYCKRAVGRKFHLDHVVPIALGGSNERHNRQITCPRCNLQKGRMDPFAFARRLGRLL